MRRHLSSGFDDLVGIADELSHEVERRVGPVGEFLRYRGKRRSSARIFLMKAGVADGLPATLRRPCLSVRNDKTHHLQMPNTPRREDRSVVQRVIEPYDSLHIRLLEILQHADGLWTIQSGGSSHLFRRSEGDERSD